MKIKVLIVEDEILIAEDLADFLRESGFHVCGIALSAEECFALIEKDRPDILILDIFLKGALNGTEIANTLNEESSIPFIFLTANTDETTVQKALSQSPGAYISKPFNKNDVRIAIELVCQKHNDRILQKASEAAGALNFIFVKEGSLYKGIELKAILYIEAKGSYSVIVTSNKSYTLSYNLSYFRSQVKDHFFKKVHRSFIVNITKVEAFDNNSFIINDRVIPVSKQYQKEIASFFLKL